MRRSSTRAWVFVLAAMILAIACPSWAAGTFIESSASCNGSLVAHAVSEARASIPDSSVTGYNRSSRARYLQDHILELFDEGHKGGLNAREFVDYQWAYWLTFAPRGACEISQATFLWANLGDKKDKYSGWHIAGSVAFTKREFRSLDHGGKGYLTKDDIAEDALKSFEGIDKNRDGIVTLSEMHLG